MAKKRKAKRPTKEDLPEEVAGIATVKLTSLEAENILRIKAVRLNIDELGDVVTIQARNQQGKSSLLKIVEMAIAGATTIPADPIHGKRGQGKVIARFDTNIGQLVVTREFTRGKDSKLVVRLEGQRRALTKAQTILDVLMDHIGLDLRQFENMPDEEKGQVLAEMTGLDLGAINTKRQQAFDERKEVNRDVKRLKAEHGATTFHRDAPKSEVVVSELVKELDGRREHNARGGELDNTLRAAASTLLQKRDHVKMLHAAIAELEEHEAKTLAEVAEFVPLDEDEVRKQIDDADEINAKVRDNAKHAKTKADFASATAEADAFTSQIEQLDADKKKMLVEAESRLPVDGLGFTEDGILTYKGKPFSQAGRSASAVVSCGVSIKLNEDKLLKIVLLDDAEKMDRETRKQIEDMVIANGFQMFMTQVTPDAGPSEGAVIIEDGEVVE